MHSVARRGGGKIWYNDESYGLGFSFFFNSVSVLQISLLHILFTNLHQKVKYRTVFRYLKCTNGLA